MALAGPPRSHENGSVANADVGPDWCHIPSRREPVQQCDAGASGTPNCCLTSTNTRLSTEEAPLGDHGSMARDRSEGRQMWKGSSSGAPYARRAQELGYCVREDPRRE